MLPSLPRFLPAAGFALLVAAAGHAAEPAIIAKARAFVGSEAALNAVNSVHYVGTLTTPDPTDPKKPATAALEIIFQKPDQQRIQAIGPRIIEVTALDGYDGWQRQQDVSDKSKWQQMLLGPEQIKNLRANTWESLYFFRGIEARGGRVEERGGASFDGVDCVKVAFLHDGKIGFIRYFEKATGRLVFTETNAGSTLREEGEMRVAGVRFPKSIVATSKDPATGQMKTTKLTFDKITVNEVFPASVFQPPMLQTR